MDKAVDVRPRARWGRRIGIVFAVLILLLVVLYFVATSSAFLKGVILPRAGKSLNAQITVDDASISPFSAVTLKNFRLKTTGDQPLVSANEVRLRYHLMDIIKGHINVDEVTLDTPTVSIVKEADGSSNLDPLLKGESGTGKEVIARAIHNLSPRAKGPMVTVHCAALPATLLESELFGHEKGAFTGAHERRIGRAEQAQGGTLFLDEIGEIDATIQIKLLRFLGERTFERVGSSKTLTADVRLIAATNKDLKSLVKAGAFREDLFFRLSVVPIWLPPLRQRLQDVPLLAGAFLREFAKENDKVINGFEAAALEAMMNYDWPGNVRELRSAVERAVVFCRKDQISLKDLPAEVRGGFAASSGSSARPLSIADRQMTVQEAEKQLIIQALQDSDGNRTEAAKKLGMSRRTLHRKLHKYGLEGF
jgi:DNA-binding NtrC family response regulator